jgi:hypothetical protein
MSDAKSSSGNAAAPSEETSSPRSTRGVKSFISYLDRPLGELREENDGERINALRQLTAILRSNGKSWQDVFDLAAKGEAGSEDSSLRQAFETVKEEYRRLERENTILTSMVAAQTEISDQNERIQTLSNEVASLTGQVTAQRTLAQAAQREADRYREAALIVIGQAPKALLSIAKRKIYELMVNETAASRIPSYPLVARFGPPVLATLETAAVVASAAGYCLTSSRPLLTVAPDAALFTVCYLWGVFKTNRALGVIAGAVLISSVTWDMAPDSAVADKAKHILATTYPPPPSGIVKEKVPFELPLYPTKYNAAKFVVTDKKTMRDPDAAEAGWQTCISFNMVPFDASEIDGRVTVVQKPGQKACFPSDSNGKPAPAPGNG